jgi:O-antigen ligase
MYEGRAGGALAWSVALTLAVAPWLRGGTVVRFQPYLFIPVAFLLVCWLWAAWQARGAKQSYRLFKDPALWPGSLLLLVIAAQWYNAGQYAFFHPVKAIWTYTPPRLEWLPGAVTAAEALEYLRWFTPFVLLGLVMRSPFMHRQHHLLILQIVLLNAALLAILGILQVTAGGFAFWGLQHLTVYYFATFGYPNHAGAYFLLMTGLGLGLMVYQLRQRSARGLNYGYFLMYVPATLLVVVACLLSLSRASIIFVTLLLMAGLIWTTIEYWARWRPVQRLNYVLGLFVVSAFLVMGVSLVSQGRIHQEIQTLVRSDSNKVSSAANELLPEVRGALIGAAWGMWKDYPVYGVGAWGFRYRIHEYIAQSHLARPSGRANTHNDPVQFLAELGLVGFLPLVVFTALVGLRGLRHGRRWRHAAVGIPLLAVGMVFAHSLIDLPFRSPAVLYHWLALFALAPVLAPPLMRVSAQPHIEPQAPILEYHESN